MSKSSSGGKLKVNKFYPKIYLSNIIFLLILLYFVSFFDYGSSENFVKEVYADLLLSPNKNAKLGLFVPSLDKIIKIEITNNSPTVYDITQTGQSITVSPVGGKANPADSISYEINDGGCISGERIFKPTTGATFPVNVGFIQDCIKDTAQKQAAAKAAAANKTAAEKQAAAKAAADKAAAQKQAADKAAAQKQAADKAAAQKQAADKAAAQKQAADKAAAQKQAAAKAAAANKTAAAKAAAAKNKPPVVKIPPQLTMNENTKRVIAPTTFNDENPNQVTFLWEQVAGDAKLNLTPNNQRQVTLTAPEILPPNKFGIIKLTANDGTNPPVGSNQLQVTILNVNKPPIIKISKVGPVLENKSVVLDTTGTI